MQPGKILIVGAGPTGLTAAIELYRYGFKPRLIDRKSGTSPLSRAVGINSRSLELLDSSGATAALLDKGIKMREGFLFQDGVKIGELKLSQIPHRYNFLLSLPQNETEEVLHERLRHYGGEVEYGCSLVSLAQENGIARAAIQCGETQATQTYDLVIGADGIHSHVREAAAIPFEGFDYKTKWSIADFESRDIPFKSDHVHLFLGRAGRIGVLVGIGPGRFRAVADVPEALPTIPAKFTIDKLYRKDDFVISVRQAATYQKGCIFLAGDAAHVHSPAGGRGMNLGIEDACDLARRIAENDLDGYTTARHPVGRSVLKMSEALVHIATLKNPVMIFLRRCLFGILSAFPILQKPIVKKLSGLK